MFQRLFKRGEPEQEKDQPTPPPTPETSPVQAGKTTPPPSRLGWVFASAQSVGQIREHNEDSLFTFTTHLAYQEKQFYSGLFVVADGMGGHVDGELASGLAVRSMAKQVINKLPDIQMLDQPEQIEDGLKNLLMEAIDEANRAVKNQVPGGGTTLTALLIHARRHMIIHVGDSRAYEITPDGAAKILTHDHSFVRQLVDLGQISPQDAESHPQRNILSMALGQLDPLEPDFYSAELPPSGHFLICSDGLWGLVPEAKIIETIQSTDDLQAACKQLITVANQAGGPDNITAILIRIPE